jgi:diheme cytochrome c
MRFAALVLSAALFAPLAAMAAEDSVPPVTDPLVKKECGACHMAFQPAFLPPASWRKMMATLDDHFGEDASLDTGTRDKIEAYLAANARRGRGDRANPPFRITKLNWFRSEHREGEVRSLRKRRNVKTLADCAACHRGADRGYFEDD